MTTGFMRGPFTHLLQNQRGIGAKNSFEKESHPRRHVSRREYGTGGAQFRGAEQSGHRARLDPRALPGSAAAPGKNGEHFTLRTSLLL